MRRTRRIVGLLVVALLALTATVVAQGGGFFVRVHCAEITHPIAGQTWCGEASSLQLKVWDGAQFVPGLAGVSLLNGLQGALSILGTTNQVSIVSGGSAITLSLPQDIAPGSSPAFLALTVSALGIAGNRGRPVVLATTGALTRGSAWVDVTQVPGWDGTPTENRTAIDGALTTLGAAGGTLQLPAGTYDLDCTMVTVSAPVTIRGVSREATILQNDVACTNDLFHVEGFAVTVENLSLQSTAIRPAGAGLSVGTASPTAATDRFTLRNANITNQANGVLGTNMGRASITNTMFAFNGLGVQINDGVDNKISDNFFINNSGQFGHIGLFGGGGLLITGNKFNGGVRSLYANPSTNIVDLLVAGNSIEDWDSYGIELTTTNPSGGLSDVVITGNQIRDVTGTGLGGIRLIGDGLHDVTITGNNIILDKSDATGVLATTVADVTITGNMIRAGALGTQVGINATGGTRVSTGANYFRNILNQTSGALTHVTSGPTGFIGAQDTVRIFPWGAGAGNTGEVRLFELATNGGNYGALKGADSVAADFATTWFSALPAGTECVQMTAAGILQTTGAPCGGGAGGGTVTNTGALGAGGIVYGNGGVDVSAVVLIGFVKANGALAPTASATIPTTGGGLGADVSALSGILSLNAGAAVVSNVLTATRLLYAAAGNTVTSSANLTFDGTTLKLAGLAPASTNCVQIDSTGVIGVSGSTCGGGGGAGVDSINGHVGAITLQGTASQVTIGTVGTTITASLPATINVNTSGNAATATLASTIAGVGAGEIPYGSATNTLASSPNMQWDNANAALGLKVPSGAGRSTLDVRGRVTIADFTSQALEIMANSYSNGAGDKYLTTGNGGAGRLEWLAGAWHIQTAPSGTADAAVTYTTRATFDVNGLTLLSPLTVPNGGTGFSSGVSGGVPFFSSPTALGSSPALTHHGMLVGGGDGAAPGSVAALTNGQLYCGSTGANPVPCTLTSPGSTITFTAGAGSLTLDAAGLTGGSPGRIPFWTASSTIGSDPLFLWNNTSKGLNLANKALLNAVPQFQAGATVTGLRDSSFNKTIAGIKYYISGAALSLVDTTTTAVPGAGLGDVNSGVFWVQHTIGGAFSGSASTGVFYQENQAVSAGIGTANESKALTAVMSWTGTSSVTPNSIYNTGAKIVVGNQYPSGNSALVPPGLTGVAIDVYNNTTTASPVGITITNLVNASGSALVVGSSQSGAAWAKAFDVLDAVTDVSRMWITGTGSIYTKGPHPWIDVKAYGAVCDRTTNDQAAIQNAINAVPATGGTVFVPAMCRVATTVTIIGAHGSNLSFTGNGPGSGLTTDQNIALITVDTTAGRIDNLHVENMQLMNTGGTTTDIGIKLVGGAQQMNQTMFRHLVFTGVSIGINNQRTAAGFDWNVFDGLEFWNYGARDPAYGIKFERGGGGTGNIYTNINGVFTVAGIQIDDPTANGIGDMTMSNVQMAGSGGGSPYGIKITGNVGAYRDRFSFTGMQFDAGINGFNFSNLREWSASDIVLGGAAIHTISGVGNYHYQAPTLQVQYGDLYLPSRGGAGNRTMCLDNAGKVYTVASGAAC